MSTTDESDDDKFGILGDQTDFEARREPDWQWSTGRNDNSLVIKKAKKRFIIPGEKKQMKKLHMARLREERAERKISRRKKKQGAVNNSGEGDNKDNMRWIERVRRDFEVLAQLESEPSLSDGGEEESYLIFTDVSRTHAKLVKALALRYRLEQTTNTKEDTLIIKRTRDSYIPEPNSKERAEIDDICTPIMSREEYLNSPERMERLRLRKIRHAADSTNQTKKESKKSMFRRKKDEKLPSFSISVDFVPSTGTDVDTNTTRSKKLVDAVEIEQSSARFAKFANDISRKMMEKMGFSGRGLGPKEDGIKTPIDVTQRKKNLGLGA